MKLWYMSFAGEERFLGAVISHGKDLAEALLTATQHGCNPGGEVMAIEIPDNQLPDPETPILILLSRDDLEKYGFEPQSSAITRTKNALRLVPQLSAFVMTAISASTRNSAGKRGT